MNRYEPKMRELNAMPVIAPRRLSDADFQDAERILGGVLPEDYREFIRDFSGFGVNVEFPVQADEPYIDGLEVIKGIVTDDGAEAFDIVRSYLQRNPDVMQDDWVSLGWNSGSGGAVYAFKGPDRGKVFSLNHNYEPCLVANSFDEFMNLLKSQYDEPEAAEDAAPFWSSFSTD